MKTDETPRELTEEELEFVTGGGGDPPPPHNDDGDADGVGG
jgi:hypothetical protein